MQGVAAFIYHFFIYVVLWRAWRGYYSKCEKLSARNAI